MTIKFHNVSYFTEVHDANDTDVSKSYDHIIFYSSELLLTCQDHGNKTTLLNLAISFYNVIFEHKLYDTPSVY